MNERETRSVTDVARELSTRPESRFHFLPLRAEVRSTSGFGEWRVRAGDSHLDLLRYYYREKTIENVSLKIQS